MAKVFLQFKIFGVEIFILFVIICREIKLILPTKTHNNHHRDNDFVDVCGGDDDGGGTQSGEC